MKDNWRELMCEICVCVFVCVSQGVCFSVCVCGHMLEAVLIQRHENK